MTGWDPNFLQEAVNLCTNPSGRIEDCPIFELQDEFAANRCHMKTPDVLTSENTEGPGLSALPGNVAITFGDGSSEGGAPAPDPAPPAAPTLTYQPGSNPSGVPLPGDVFKENPDYQGQTATTADNIGIQAVGESPTTAPPAPQTTPGPETQDDRSYYSTEYVTVGKLVSKILWVQEIAYVTLTEDSTATVTVTAGQKAKRHVHQHHHYHHRL
jgi:hypothetical protein